jgi:hypothetical protein
MSKGRPLEHKPLSFTTTLRNPERIAGFLTCLRKYNGHVLTNEVIEAVAKDLIGAKLYKTMFLLRNPGLRSIYKDEEGSFSISDLNLIVTNSPQNHKEAGFDKGWPSRFDTWYKICKELGLAYYAMGEPISISESGNMLCDAYDVESIPDDPSKVVRNVFLNALVKYNSNNPFRKNANKNVPLILLMRVIRLLKDDTTQNGAGIFRREIPFVLCWPNNDPLSLYCYIKDFRKTYGFTASDDVVYEKCLKLLGSDSQIRFKKVQVTKEGPDDFLRKVRITGMFSVRGMGRFLDLNQFEIARIEYVLANYGATQEFANALSYYHYVGTLDPNLVSLESSPDAQTLDNLRKGKLQEVSAAYSRETILGEMLSLANQGACADAYLKDIDEPTRLEFLTSVALQQTLLGADVSPNYPIDDEGNPTFTARGGVADIIVTDGAHTSIVEVTLLRSKQQAVLEIPGITRHLQDLSTDQKSAIFVAPLLHQDAEYMILFSKAQYGVNIHGYSIKDFCAKLEVSSELLQLAV